ncbi:MAG: nucleotidyltransferase domain-containing protein [Nitrospirae bacterium]|jgi:predicted nucleotidyltransferase|nr:nucleotidyltransferase domain-containing protein [Nitrospirota bacterium]MCL5062088.1 nucleotidyltransferase domain-containing protein [Nitrospirota bacterium]MDA8338977.1 nucleotidyltransferase domain-containing protein [Nitrospiraceae bacterium]
MAETVLSKRRRELKENLRQKALQRLEQAVRLLYSEGAEDVYVFGSVLRPLEFNEHSDVDIAVKGIPEDRRVFVTVSLEGIFGEVPFDIVFLEDDLRSEIRDRIKKDGVLWKR